MNKPTFDAMLAQYEVKETGKNLFDAANATQFSGTCSLTEKTKDGHLTVMTKSSGTYTSVNIQIPIFPEGTEMTLSAKWVASGKNDGGLRIVWQGVDKTYLAGSKTFGTINTSGESVTFIMPKQPENAAYLVINFFGNRSSKNAVAGDTVTYSEIMLTFGSDFMKYEPYTGDNKDFVFWDNGVHCVIPSVKISGKAEQTAYTGKNLLDYRLATRRGKNVLTGGEPLELVDNGVIMPAGEQYYFRIPCELEPGEYTCSWTGKNDLGEFCEAYRFVCADGSYPYSSYNGKVCVVEQPVVALMIYKHNNDVVLEQDLIITNLQLEKNSSATSYEPYTGGIPAPNPEYPIMPVFSEGTTVVSRGKNLADIGSRYSSWGGDQYTTVVREGAYQDNQLQSTLIPVIGGKTYCATWKGTTFNGRYFWFDQQPVIDKTVSIDGGYFSSAYPRISVTAPKNAKWLLFIFFVESTWTEKLPVTDCQLELGSIFTSYEPYFDGGSATAPILLLADVDGARQSTWNPQTGKGLNWWHDMIVLDGSSDETWELYNQDGFRGFQCLNVFSEIKLRAAYWCNLAASGREGYAPGDKIHCWAGKRSRHLYVVTKQTFTSPWLYDPNLADCGLSNWKAHLAEHPLKIWVARNEPVPFETASQPLIQPKDTCNIIQTEGTISNCPISVKYLAHK